MILELISSWLPSAFATGTGAFCGALSAYFLACRKEDKRRKTEYLCLLLVLYDRLEALYSTLADIPDAAIKEVDGVRVVEFDLPLPYVDISSEQMLRLVELSPDKQMPSALIHLQQFLMANAKRVEKSGTDVLPMDSVNHYVRQLQFMLLSVKTQYEQATNGDFPLDELTRK